MKVRDELDLLLKNYDISLQTGFHLNLKKNIEVDILSIPPNRIDLEKFIEQLDSVMREVFNRL